QSVRHAAERADDRGRRRVQPEQLRRRDTRDARNGHDGRSLPDTARLPAARRRPLAPWGQDDERAHAGRDPGRHGDRARARELAGSYDLVPHGRQGRRDRHAHLPDRKGRLLGRRARRRHARPDPGDHPQHALRPALMAKAQEFVKAMTLTDATMLVAGSMIGSGIFVVSADIARQVQAPFWLIAAWLAAGAMTLLGALSHAELAAMYPKAGGQYVFLRESMGPLMGFLYGWTLFLVIQTGTIAAVAVAFARFLGVLLPWL